MKDSLRCCNSAAMTIGSRVFVEDEWKGKFAAEEADRGRDGMEEEKL